MTSRNLERSNSSNA